MQFFMGLRLMVRLEGLSKLKYYLNIFGLFENSNLHCTIQSHQAFINLYIVLWPSPNTICLVSVLLIVDINIRVSVFTIHRNFKLPLQLATPIKLKRQLQHNDDKMIISENFTVQLQLIISLLYIIIPRITSNNKCVYRGVESLADERVDWKSPRQAHSWVGRCRDDGSSAKSLHTISNRCNCCRLSS